MAPAIKAFTLDALETSPALRDDVPPPTPAANEVLVRVHASSVNPVDAGIAAGQLSGMFEYDFPVTLGRDYAGVVEEVGPDVTRYAVGDEVYGYVAHANPAVHEGSWAEFIAVAEDAGIARKPDGVETKSAGAAPLAGITAMLAVDALEVSDGDTVLIVGAAGGVGSLAAQSAARAGATVIAPALPEDEAYLRGLGVSEVLPRDGDVSAAVRERHPAGVDALFDLVSYAPGAFDAALNDGARVVSPNGAAGEGAGRTNVMAQPTTELLDRVGAALADGSLRVPVQATYQLDRAGEALQALGATHTQGKLAISLG